MKKLNLLLLLFLSVFIVWPIFLPGYFFHHDDLQVMRIFEMRKCFNDLQIPCRWVPDMGYGYGFPLFNYYGVLPYYIGAILSYILGFIWSAKLLFFIPLVSGGIFMYFFLKELFGELEALVGGLLYLFAPYRALDAYVRGAIAESFALALAPLVFFFLLRLIKNKTKINFLGVSISLFLFLTSHNIMTLFFTPLFILWIIFELFVYKKDHVKEVILSSLLGFGSASFFLVPAFFEKGLVQSESLVSGGFDFRVHFVGVKQLFLDRSWGFGASVFGPEDTISFQIGWPHWFLIVITGLFLILISLNFKKGLFKRYFDKKDSRILFIYIFWLVVFLLSIFLMHNKSAFIWERVNVLQYSQFPWRLLSITIFSSSIIGGLLVYLLKGRARVIFTVFIVMITVLLNWNYFKPADFYFNVGDSEKLNGQDWEFQQKAGLLDYLPKTAKEPLSKAPELPVISEGKGQVYNYRSFSNRWEFEAKINEFSKVEVPVFDFPNWVVSINRQMVRHEHDNYLGTITLSLDKGYYAVVGEFKNTFVRNLGNNITLGSWILLFFYLVRVKYGNR